METAAVAITIFNARVDAETKREVYQPTRIGRVSFLESRGSNHSSGMGSETLAFKIRIPENALFEGHRTYVNESVYKTLSSEEARRHWTLRKGDLILLSEHDDLPIMITQPELDALARSLHTDLIRITEYADNTVRGSKAMHHWRIGGA